MKDSVNIQIVDMDDLIEFRQTISQFSGEAYLIKGTYKCDAKSLMGILAIDVSSPTKLEFDISDREEILALMNKYIVKSNS